MPTSFRLATALALAASLHSCSLHSSSRRWNGLVGLNGEPIFVQTSTNIGFNLGIILPFLGKITMESMLDEASASIAYDGGDRLRVIQTSTENYWYGFPPFTWIITPVITDVAIEYEPSPAQLLEVQLDDAAEPRQHEAARRKARERR